MFYFRYYYHVLPIDQALTIAGAVLFAIVYLLVRYLKRPKHGFTYAEPEDANMLGSLRVESLIAETFAQAPTVPADQGDRFDGGDFGGGGASGDF